MTLEQKLAFMQRTGKQINGREGAGSDFVIALSVKLGVAWWQFRPHVTSIVTLLSSIAETSE